MCTNRKVSTSTSSSSFFVLCSSLSPNRDDHHLRANLMTTYDRPLSFTFRIQFGQIYSAVDAVQLVVNMLYLYSNYNSMVRNKS
ncbi:hypothetical protein BLOT_007581 [Blomia tropicalis]|nr:hypothetical protein BLOT_007581 [Blomia tropicalis]